MAANGSDNILVAIIKFIGFLFLLVFAAQLGAKFYIQDQTQIIQQNVQLLQTQVGQQNNGELQKNRELNVPRAEFESPNS